MQDLGALVVMMHGVTAAGKTTTSKYLAQALNAIRLATSQVRGAVGARAAAQGDERRDEAYAEVADRLRVGLRTGGRFVLDGTYALRRWREPIYRICGELKVPLYVVHCVCDDEDEVHRRIEDRKRRAPKSPDSEADRFFFLVSEKHHFEELLADDFRQGGPEAIIVVDTFKGALNTVSLVVSDSSVAGVIRNLWEILGNEPMGSAFGS
jgi:predicted kinase